MSKKKEILLIICVGILLLIFGLSLYINRDKLVVVADETHTTEDIYLNYLFDEVSKVEGISVNNVNFDGLTFNERINYAIDKVKASLIVAYASDKEMKMFAENYKDIIFITLGTTYDESLDNLIGIKFNEYNIGYILGYLASITTTTNKIGFIGTEEKINEELLNGIYAGALKANSEITIAVDYMGKETYKNGFYQNKNEDITDSELAYNKANALYESGVDIVIETANNSSEGIIKSAEKKNKYVISDCINKSNNILACFERDITYALNEVVKDYKNNNLKNNYIYDINNGFNISMFKNVSDETIKLINEIIKDM